MAVLNPTEPLVIMAVCTAPPCRDACLVAVPWVSPAWLAGIGLSVGGSLGTARSCILLRPVCLGQSGFGSFSSQDIVFGSKRI